MSRVRFAAYVPTLEDVQQCHDRLMSAGGLLAIGVDSQEFESDFFQATIERAATLEVIEGVRFYKARVKPLVVGLQHGCEAESCLTSTDDPQNEMPF